MGLGLYAWPRADGAFAYLHGQGCENHRLHAHGNSWRFGTRDRSDHWCDSVCRNADDAHYGGYRLDSRRHCACGREKVSVGQWGRTLRVLWGMGFDRSNLNFLFMWLVNLNFFCLLL